MNYGVINNRQSMESFRDELKNVMKRINERNEIFQDETRILGAIWRDENFAEFFNRMRGLEAQRELCQVCYDDMVQTLNAEIDALLRLEQVRQGR